MQKIGVNEVRSALEEILKRVHLGKTSIAISRQNQAVAALVPMEDLALIEAARAQGRLDAAAELQRANEALKAEIAERERTEQKLRQSESRLKRAAEMAGFGYYVWDLLENRCTYCTEEYARFHGMTVEEYMATSAAGDVDVLFVHPEDRERYERVFNETLARNEPMNIEYRILTRDGEVRHIHEIEEKFEYVDGRPVRSEGTLQDVTAFKKAEEQLRQAQRMEAVGQLSGGVAHDFNNLLSVVLGHAELLADQLGKDNRSVATILAATKRGADLTQQLLAYSRRQTLRPQPVELGDLVLGLTALIERTFGESIQVETRIAPDLWHPFADPGQIESALLNLAVNARDAMPEGGRLAISCENRRLDQNDKPERQAQPSGQFVSLAVSDSGTGMAKEVLAHAFEPFFTTKEVGKGSGLGLSMVYGFAKQSGGHVEIDSEPGCGTCVTLLLPQAAVISAPLPAAPREVAPRGRGESILVIEDYVTLRDLAQQMLTGLGYRPIGVADAESAFELLAEGRVVDLVLSDVALPAGMTGLAIAAQLAESHPGIKVLFMSGHPTEAALPSTASAPQPPILAKPFERIALAKAIRRALETEGERSQSTAGGDLS